MSRPEDEEWTGRVGRIDAKFVSVVVPDISSRRVHICGPMPMMDAVRDLMIEVGVPKQSIKREAFGTAKRDPTKKSMAADAKQFKVVFATSKRTIKWSSAEPILDAAESCDVDIPSACRSVLAWRPICRWRLWNRRWKHANWRPN